ncbi:MAG: hypothetical protein IIB77_12385 [Proteobacteria bacterium]|nr:hypothetical protein [Pseudomonadota bacterium]
MADDNGASKLDTLLKEWDEKKGPSEDYKDVLTRMEKLEADNKDLREKADVHDKEKKDAAEADAYTEDIKPVIKTLKGETNASDDFAENWLNALANKDKKLASVWNNRTEKPEAFDKAIEALIPKFKKDAEAEARKILNVKDDELGDTKENKDGRRVSQATRIARNNAETLGGDDYDDVDWGGLNGAEFARKREQVFADMRSGKLKAE